MRPNTSGTAAGERNGGRTDGRGITHVGMVHSGHATFDVKRNIRQQARVMAGNVIAPG